MLRGNQAGVGVYISRLAALTAHPCCSIHLLLEGIGEAVYCLFISEPMLFLGV